MGLSSRVSMWPVCKFPWPGKTLVDAEVVWKRGRRRGTGWSAHPRGRPMVDWDGGGVGMGEQF